MSFFNFKHMQQVFKMFVTENSLQPSDVRGVPAALLCSQNLLYAIKTNADTKALLRELAYYDILSLSNELSHPDDRKAFWLNIANALIQMLLEKQPNTSFAQLRKYKSFVIAGRKLSINDILDGLLANSRVNWGFLSFNNPFALRYERRLSVKFDFRTIFALNFGQPDAPAIRFYSGKKLDKELHDAMATYLFDNFEVDDEKHQITISDFLYKNRKSLGGKASLLYLAKIFKILNDKQSEYHLTKAEDKMLTIGRELKKFITPGATRVIIRNVG